MTNRTVPVRAIRRDGTWGAVDVLDLDDESFRRFIVDILIAHDFVYTIKAEDDTPIYRERTTDH